MRHYILLALTLLCLATSAQNQIVRRQGMNKETSTVHKQSTTSSISNAKERIRPSKDNSRIVNGHKFVDLALPSGLLWATCNVGASSPSGSGVFFAWGETSTKSKYSREAAKYTSEYDFIKYTENDGRTVLERSDDAASMNWGYPCRMPTKSEFEELFRSSNCKWTKTGSCYKVTSKRNGNSIILPTCGYYQDTRLYNSDTGYYWTSSLILLRSIYDTSSHHAYFATFGKNGVDFHTISNTNRYEGLSVRPVVKL